MKLKEQEPLTSIEKYHLKNVYQLHLDEEEILEKNLEYLKKTMKSSIFSVLK